MKFYLAGQHNFGNRGCEALVRSVVHSVRSRLPGATFLVPTLNRRLDGQQWPQMEEQGGEFVSAAPNPPVIKWWNRLTSRLPAALPLWEPRYTPARHLQEDFSGADAVLMIGGDVISLDYGAGSLFQWSGLMDAAHRAGRPTMLYAASVGPFSAEPAIERFMLRHLQRYSAITVRESASLDYLRRLGLDQAQLVADPAFLLHPQACELGGVFDRAPEGVLGFNLSPLVAVAWQRANPGRSLLSEAGAFLRRVLAETGLHVALIPHVDPLDGGSENSDTHYMHQLFQDLGGASERLVLMPRGLNAAQTKYVVGACRYLIAARTHATVASWSQQVPTISIAYSVKAIGLNQDLFQSQAYVLKTPEVSSTSLWSALQTLVRDEPRLRQLLSESMPEWKGRAQLSAGVLADMLR